MAPGNETKVSDLQEAEQAAALRLALIEKDTAYHSEQLELLWKKVSEISDIAKKNQTLLAIASSLLALVASGLVAMWVTK